MPDQTSGFDEVRHDSTVERYVGRLLQGTACYTLAEVAERAGMDVDLARRFWLSMGFPTINEEEKEQVFTDDDVAAMIRHQQALTSGLLSVETMNSLIRAESHMSDRLVLWQFETLVQHAMSEFKLDGVSARFWVLDHFEDYQTFLQDQMEYSWRRHLAALMRRSEAEASQMDLLRNSGEELQRALGFVDMVAFTNRSNELRATELVDLIEVFEHTCRDIISAKGARVVKTIGDAFLFIADDLVTGAETATAIVEKLRSEPGMLPVRASLVWGGVVSRFGDIFGRKVNLASRLVDIAVPGSVYTDQDTAEILRQLKLGRFTLVPAGSPDLKGYGRINAVELRRMPGGHGAGVFN